VYGVFKFIDGLNAINWIEFIVFPQVSLFCDICTIYHRRVKNLLVVVVCNDIATTFAQTQIELMEKEKWYCVVLTSFDGEKGVWNCADSEEKCRDFIDAVVKKGIVRLEDVCIEESDANVSRVKQYQV
jgi:hypothetical protein